MSLGIQCLTTDDDAQALELARQLDTMNHERRTIETTMREQALAYAEQTDPGARASVCVYHPDWHQGVVGLVASRLKETYWRPTLAFARADNGELRGSGRSIPDVHLRDVLDLVSKRHPGIILKFGGHAMAAGLTLQEQAYPDFPEYFDQAVKELSGRDSFEPVIETDGSLETGYANVDVAGLLHQHVWGAGFPAPVFRDTFQVQQQRLLKGKHLKLTVQRGTQRFDAIWFNRADVVSDTIEAAYRLDQNSWNGQVTVQLVIEHAIDL
jgi:single-stranded-DNA-specific exonuclease